MEVEFVTNKISSLNVCEFKKHCFKCIILNSLILMVTIKSSCFELDCPVVEKAWS